MSQEPYRSAQRVFWVMDNCSAHRGPEVRPSPSEPVAVPVPLHSPVHASRLNQIEIYFSIVQRIVLTPNDFASLAELEQRLLAKLAFQQHYEKIATPLRWAFTRQDLTHVMAKLKKEVAAA
jgi:hypothetical protein